MAGVARTTGKRDDAPDAYRSSGAFLQTLYSDSHHHQKVCHTFGNEDGYVPTWYGNQNTHTIQNAYTNQDPDSDKDQDTNADQDALADAYSVEKKPPPSR